MIKVFTDGAFQPRTLAAGLAIIININGQQTQYKIHIPKVYDNHQAEFIAMDQALKILESRHLLKDTLFIYSDSKILVQSVEKAYVKDPQYRAYLKSILSRFQLAPLAFIQWIPEKENRGADVLAKQALRQQGKLISLIESV